MINKRDNTLRDKNLKNLFVLFGSILTGEIEILRQLLSEGVNVNSRLQDISLEGIELDSSKATISNLDTPLLIALKHNADFETIKFLLENGADITLMDQNGKTAIDIASEKNLNTVLKLFKLNSSE